MQGLVFIDIWERMDQGQLATDMSQTHVLEQLFAWLKSSICLGLNYRRLQTMEMVQMTKTTLRVLT